MKCHLLTHKALWLLAGGQEQDQCDTYSGRITPRKPNSSPSTQNQMEEVSKAGTGASAEWGE